MNLIKSEIHKISNKNIILFTKRWLSTAENQQKRRSDLFTLEQRHQRDKVGRIEKINIKFQGLPNDADLIMNKRISTPFHCAQHLGEIHCKQSAIALIDGTTPWDMHRPLENSCTLQFLNFHINDPHIVNRAFWRTCSFMLGAVVQECVKDIAGLQLHSFPSPNIKSGSFVHDIGLNLSTIWQPTKEELRAISAEMIKLAGRKLKIERLEVNHDLALEMFHDNPYKREQLPSISRNGSVILYRVGQHVDISRGPMIASTEFLGKCTISSVHQVADKDENGNELYRVQGVALPSGFVINHVAFGILEERSKKLNSARLPNEPFDEHSMESMIA